MRRPDELIDGAARALSTRLASGMTRRSFLGRMGGAVLAATGGAAVAAAVRPEKGEAFHFCGHTWTTGSCPNPLGLPRIDKAGFPLRPRDGHPIDNLGRAVDGSGFAIDGTGKRLKGPDGSVLPRAPRTRLCEEWTHERYRLPDTRMQGSWFRCCNGQIRKLVDCCSKSKTRINGDASLTGYCWDGKRVFCVMYYDSGLKC
ncbi:MAG TPA: hypothetical protein VH281_00445 [Gaiellaceae bacterium]|jgi:hypothetical protein